MAGRRSAGRAHKFEKQKNTLSNIDSKAGFFYETKSTTTGNGEGRTETYSRDQKTK
jgi:hypothetical protein